MSKFKYPVDTDQFVEIREKGLLYVDKTGLMYKLVTNYKYVFLARPRRFGKSLLCTTLKAYFEGRRDLFDGLEVAKHETQWEKHPVLHFTMSGLKNCTIAEAKSKLESLIYGYEKIYGNDPRYITPGDRFRNLIHNAAEKSKKNVVIILDEYDAPIMRLMHDRENLERMRTMLREFYQVLKDEGNYIKFVFITGVTKFAQLSIFSELNNLMPISMEDEYSGICGFTQDELNSVMRPCIEEYAESLNISIDEAYALLKQNYDGYHFSPNSQDVYAPFSLLRALHCKNAKHYWFESGTSTSLIEHLRKFQKFNPLDYDGIVVSENAFNSPCEDASTPIPLLYQSGYLTIDTYDPCLNTYRLHFPNGEVRQGLVENLVGYLMDADELDRDAAVIAMATALWHGDLPTALQDMRAWIASLPYDIISKKQWMAKKSTEAFYKMLMYVVFTMLNSKVSTEVKSILGRADVVIKTPKYIYVLELKVDKSVEDALAQIDSKGYAIPYEADERTLYKCGVTISSEARNITHWRITDAGGNIVDEEKF